jgi:hypothetical protein
MSLVWKVARFLASNPNPSDEAFHQWAEKNNVNVHQAEAAAYKLATLYARMLTGGYWQEQGRPHPDEEQLRKGIKVELEHTPDQFTARRIALDHLAELPDYYDRLEKMEGGAHEASAGGIEMGLVGAYRKSVTERDADIVEALLKGPKPAQKIYNKCREDYPGKGQEYCARVAWQAFCRSKEGKNYKGCTQYGKTKKTKGPKAARTQRRGGCCR